MKGIGASALSAVGFVKNTTASSQARYTGVAYNPKTHEILGEASGQFNSIMDELVGTLHVGEEQFVFSRSTPRMSGDTPAGRRSRVVKTIPAVNKANWAVQNPNYTVKVFSIDNSAITGYVANPEHEKIDFSLAPQGTGVKADLRRHLANMAPSREGGDQ